MSSLGASRPLAGTRAQIEALSQCVQSLVRTRRHGWLLVGLALLGACLVEPPPRMNETDTVDPCASEESACTCMASDCAPTTSDESAGEASTQGEPDTSATTGAGSSGTSSDEGSTSDSSSDGGSSDTSASSADTSTTGLEPTCEMLSCAECVACVDGEDQPCAAAFATCDAVNGCETAVSCLVNCGLGIDCLDDCCAGLDEQQLEAVDQLILCKSDECIAPCEMQAEFDSCA
jgi:hypothetical protein